MKKLSLLVVIIFFSFQAAFAQQQDGQNKKPLGPRRQLATIVFAGFGGAILGLSTLSFYGRPQEQLVNIAIGFAVGVIVGTAYVTFKSATTEEYYSREDKNAFHVVPYLPLTEDQKLAGAGAQLKLNF